MMKKPTKQAGIKAKNESNKGDSKREPESFKALIEDENEIGELIEEVNTIDLNPYLKADRLKIYRRMKALNVAGNISKYWNVAPELVEYIGYCHLLIGDVYSKRIEPFNRKNKNKRQPKSKNQLTKLEEKLYKFCIKKRINLNNSINDIQIQAEVRNFKNLKGKKKLHRSTVGKMLQKIRP